MQWEKKGRIYVPDGQMPWAKKYAFPPTPYFINQNVLRLYLSFCDENMVGRIGYVDVNAANPKEVIGVSPQPVLDIGAPGCFDENGLLPTTVIAVDGKLYMYYVGYQLGQKVRYFQFEGLAISEDGGTSFRRASTVPVIDRSDKESQHRTSAFVMRDNDVFKMWYTAGNIWVEANGKSLPLYNLRYIESTDGIHWPKEGQVCVDFKNADEHALGRPWVLKEDGIYKMFFSSRTKSKGYRLAYAESMDGKQWTRKDAEVGIDVSESGWDSEMICYGSVVHYKDKTYLFYNGNNCGQTGFGYAVLTK